MVHDGDRLAFRHDLLREALYEDMGTAVQRSRHLAAGRALAAGGAAPLEVAYHLVRAPATEDDMAVDWLLAAAYQAIDLNTKAELLDNALRRLAPTDPRSAEIGAEAIACLGEAGRVADAEALAERLRVHVGAGDAALLSAALADAYAQQTDPVGVLRHCDAALRHVPSLPPRLRAELLANEGFALLLAGRVDDAEAAGHRAIEAGDRHAAPSATDAGRGRAVSLCAGHGPRSGRSRDGDRNGEELAIRVRHDHPPDDAPQRGSSGRRRPTVPRCPRADSSRADTSSHSRHSRPTADWRCFWQASSTMRSCKLRPASHSPSRRTCR